MVAGVNVLSIILAEETLNGLLWCEICEPDLIIPKALAYVKQLSRPFVTRCGKRSLALQVIAISGGGRSIKEHCQPVRRADRPQPGCASTF